MKFRARFSDDKAARALDVTAGAPSFEATLEGVPLSGDALAVRDGVWSLVGPDGRQIEVSVAFQTDGSVRAYAAGCLFGFELLDELTARALAATGGRSTRRIAHAAAAMPGRVLRVLVAPGEQVTQGQPLLVLEAMKMENEVKSPGAGVVKEIRVSAGQTVETGELMVVLE